MINIQAIASDLEQMTCPEHGQHPQINIQDDGVSIGACCQTFHDQVAERLQTEIEAAMSKVMEEAMKHLQ